jgi:hypothetical protein
MALLIAQGTMIKLDLKNLSSTCIKGQYLNFQKSYGLGQLRENKQKCLKLEKLK